MNPRDLPAGTVYVPVLAGSTTPLPIRPTARRLRIVRCCRGRCARPWLVLDAARRDRDFKSFEHARSFVVALLDGQEPTC